MRRGAFIEMPPLEAMRARNILTFAAIALGLFLLFRQMGNGDISSPGREERQEGKLQSESRDTTGLTHESGVYRMPAATTPAVGAPNESLKRKAVLDTETVALIDEALHSARPQERMDALTKLTGTCPDKVVLVEVLMNAGEDPEEPVRLTAVNLLLSREDPRLLDWFSKVAAHDRSEKIRGRAAHYIESWSARDKSSDKDSVISRK